MIAPTFPDARWLICVLWLPWPINEARCHGKERKEDWWREFGVDYREISLQAKPVTTLRLRTTSPSTKPAAQACHGPDESVACAPVVRRHVHGGSEVRQALKTVDHRGKASADRRGTHHGGARTPAAVVDMPRTWCAPLSEMAHRTAEEPEGEMNFGCWKDDLGSYNSFHMDPDMGKIWEQPPLPSMQ